ncbi:MAG: amidohydrolase family protein [Candidatus Daviesbacteria bacterium]|nr:amidohydrolase family protein [Candidatus Daviesbacteria bacterium]
MANIKLPGLIDPHVHLREPGAIQKEDFQTGTKAAIAGGFTMILDMPNNPIATISPQALQEKIKLAKDRIFCDVGFHFGASKESIQYFPKIKNKVWGLKVYMNLTTGDLLMEDDKILESVFSSWPKNPPAGGPIIVHAEGDTLGKAIALAKKFGNQLHVAHVSLKREIEQIKVVKREGMNITCEVTPHHLFLSEEDLGRLGPYGMMKPPLESKDNQAALWQALIDGTIDMIGSDHAPHTKEEKQGEKPVYGVPGLETTLPLLLTAVNDGRLTIERMIELTYTNPRKVFDLPEQKDTFVEVDLGESYVIEENNLQTKCGWSPFTGMKVKGKVKKVVLRGQLIFDGQNIFGPYGQIL